MSAQALNIPIEISPPDSGMSAALISELAEHLQQLASNGTTQTIDLTSLPISDLERRELENTLGRGEVEITLDTIGLSRIHETAFSGIWWIKHYSADDHLIAEQIEVCLVPEIIQSHPQDILQASRQLQQLGREENPGEAHD